MFLENTFNHEEKFGWIEVICGSMFSGKTEELIRRLRRAQFAKQKVEIFKPSIETRYAEELVVSHDENEIRCTPVPSSANIRLLASEIDVVGIDVSDSTDTQPLREAFARELLQIAHGRQSRVTVLYAGSRIQKIENHGSAAAREATAGVTQAI